LCEEREVGEGGAGGTDRQTDLNPKP
jgi:hypothetical protein